MRVHINLSYSTYLLVGHFCSICYTAKWNRSRLILWSKLKIHSPSRAAKKSPQMSCPLSEAFLPFSSTSLCHPCPSVHLPSTHKCHLNSPALLARKILTSSYHSHDHILSVSAQASNVIFAPNSEAQLPRSMEQSHLMGTHSPPRGDGLMFPCTVPKAGSGDAPFGLPGMALTSEDSFLIWFSSSASKLRPDCLLACIALALAAFCWSHTWASRCMYSASPDVPLNTCTRKLKLSKLQVNKKLK